MVRGGTGGMLPGTRPRRGPDAVQHLNTYVDRHELTSLHQGFAALDLDALVAHSRASVEAAVRHAALQQASTWVVTWDDLESHSEVWLGTPDEPEAVRIDFSQALASALGGPASGLRQALGEPVYDAYARLLTHIVAAAVLEPVRAAASEGEAGTGPASVHLALFHGEDAHCIWAPGHQPDTLFSSAGGVHYATTPRDRWRAALEQGDLGALPDLIGPMLRAGDELEVLQALSIATLELARGRVERTEPERAALLQAIRALRSGVHAVWRQDVDILVANTIAWAARDPVHMAFITEHLVDPEDVRHELLAANLAASASLLGDREALLRWARLALEMGRPATSFTEDADFEAFRTDPDFQALLAGTAVRRETLDAQLVEAAGELQVGRVRELLAQGAHADSVNDWDDSALYEAITAVLGSGEARLEMVRLLLEAGATVGDELGTAVRHGPELVALLLSRGAPIGPRVAPAAIDSGDVEVVRLLIEHGLALSPLPEGADNRFEACRHHADTAMAGFLLAAGARLDERRAYAAPVLHSVAAAGNPVMIRWLVAQGMSPAAVDPQGNTALAAAASNDNAEAAGLLIALGCPTEHANEEGRTIVHECVGVGAHATLRCVLEAGAPPNHANGDGDTALHLAARDDRLQMVRLLLDHGADASLRNRDGARAADLCTSDPVRRALTAAPEPPSRGP